MIEYKELVYGCLFLYMLNTGRPIKPILFSSGIDITDALFQDFQMDTVRKIYNMFILLDWTKNSELMAKPLEVLLLEKKGESNIEYFTIDELVDIEPMLEKYNDAESMIVDTLQLFMRMNPDIISPDVTCGELFQIALQGLTHAITEDEWNQIERTSITPPSSSSTSPSREKPLDTSPGSVASLSLTPGSDKLLQSKEGLLSTDLPDAFPLIEKNEPGLPPKGGKRTRKRKIVRSKNGKTKRKYGKHPRKKTHKRRRHYKMRRYTRRK